MTKDVQDAVRILRNCLFDLGADDELPGDENAWANTCLLHAIRHLAYPDRDIYPKTRRGTKGGPIVRKGITFPYIW